MLKIILANLLFFGVLLGSFIHIEGNRNLLLAGPLMAFACFISILVMGYIFRTPRKRRKLPSKLAAVPARTGAKTEPADSQVPDIADPAIAEQWLAFVEGPDNGASPPAS